MMAAASYLGVVGVVLVLITITSTVYAVALHFRRTATWFGDLTRFRSWIIGRIRPAVVRWLVQRPKAWQTVRVLAFTARVVCWPLWWLMDSVTVLRGGRPPVLTGTSSTATSPDQDWDRALVDLVANNPSNTPHTDSPAPVGPGVDTASGIRLGPDGNAADPADQVRLDGARWHQQHHLIHQDRDRHAELLERQEQLMARQEAMNERAAQINTHRQHPANSTPAAPYRARRRYRRIRPTRLLAVAVGLLIVVQVGQGVIEGYQAAPTAPDVTTTPQPVNE
ncbi:MAG: hypothetical protein GY724_00685 [Actinomycetia bacterium]|nr:hypothetical protein [Actinomycetes bacterium]